MRDAQKGVPRGCLVWVGGTRAATRGGAPGYTATPLVWTLHLMDLPYESTPLL